MDAQSATTPKSGRSSRFRNAPPWANAARSRRTPSCAKASPSRMRCSSVTASCSSTTAIRGRRPTTDTTVDYRDLLDDPAVDAVVIATPVSTHGHFALQALQAGKHVLVEKPMTATSDEALRLIDEAERRRCVLMVDHTFVYTGAV